MKKKLFTTLLCGFLFIGLTACGSTSQTEAASKIEDVNTENRDTEDISEEAAASDELVLETESAEKQTSMSEDIVEAEEDIQTEEEPLTSESLLEEPLIAEEDITNLYGAFLADQEPIYFDKYMHKDYSDPLFETGKGYTLSELITVFQDNYMDLEKEPEINYLYMDCGNDGVKELALQFYGMNIYSPDDDSTLVYIIKEIEGKLQLCYMYETWARSSSELNYYGYYSSGGSGGATNHGWDYGYIDANGDWNFLYYMEEELDINQFWSGPIAKVAELMPDDQNIIIVTTNFEEIVYDAGYSNYDEVPRYYTYYVEDESSDEIYSTGVYKEIFEEAGVEVTTPSEIDVMIKEKETALGITEEIKQAPVLTWEE